MSNTTNTVCFEIRTLLFSYLHEKRQKVRRDFSFEAVWPTTSWLKKVCLHPQSCQTYRNMLEGINLSWNWKASATNWKKLQKLLPVGNKTKEFCCKTKRTNWIHAAVCFCSCQSQQSPALNSRVSWFLQGIVVSETGRNASELCGDDVIEPHLWPLKQEVQKLGWTRRERKGS